MKTSCDIIRDLLPLYAEQMTSQASNELVEEHLGECGSCTNYLEDLRKPAGLPEEVPIQSLKHIKKSISKSRFLTALLALSLLVSLLAGVRNFMEAEIVLTADQAIDHLEEMEDGTVRLYWRYMGQGWSSSTDHDHPANWGIVAFKRRIDLLKKKENTIRYSEEVRPDLFYEVLGAGDSLDDPRDNYWYVNVKDGTADKLLRKGEAEMPTKGLVMSRQLNYHLALSCILAGLLAAGCTWAAWACRNSRAGKWLRYLAVFFGSVSIAVLVSSGGQFVNHSGQFHNKFARSWFMSVPLFLSGYFAFELWDLSHPGACQTPVKERSCKNLRRFYTALTVVLLVFSLFMAVFSFLFVATVYMTAEEAVAGVEELENGDVKFEFTHSAGIMETQSMGDGPDSYRAALCQDYPKNVLPHRLWNKPLEPKTVSSSSTQPREYVDSLPSYWYLNPKDATADMLLWDSGDAKPQGPLMKKSWGLAYYCAGLGLLTILLALLSRSQPEIGKYLRYAAVVFGSLCIAGICITGGEFYKFENWYEMQYRIYNSLFTAIPFFLTGICALKLWDFKKQDTP